MIKINVLTAVTLLAAIVALPANAQTAPRAWVSSHGTDAAGCGAPTNPCRSLQYVHDNIIAAGGEIDILDPAGYGTITITKALSIVNDGIGTAGVQQGTSGQNAITISAGSNNTVILRGLNINGRGVAFYGVAVNSGASIEIIKCVISGFDHGVDFEPTSGPNKLLVSNTIVSNNSDYGILIGDNILCEPRFLC